MSYLTLLFALLNLAAQHPDIFARLWAAIQDGYQAVLDGVEVFKAEFPAVPTPRGDDDTLSPEEAAAEQQFAALVAGQGHRAFGDGSFKQILKWVIANPQYLTYVQHIIATFGK